MKIRIRRLLSLLLSLVMALTLAPAGLMTGASGGEEDTVAGLTLSDDGLGLLDGAGGAYTLTLEPDDTNAGGTRLLTRLDPDNANTRRKTIRWESSDTTVVSITQQSREGYGEGHLVSIVGKTPGEAAITASVDGQKATIDVTVSGITLSKELLAGLTLVENEVRTLTEGKDYFLYGKAADTGVTMTTAEVNNKTIVNLPTPTGTSSVTVEGRSEGTGTIRLRVSGGGHVYEAEFPVTVVSDLQTIEWTAGCSPSAPLKFSDLEDLIAEKCKTVTGGTLTSILGVSMLSTDQGTLYLGYKSPEDTGAGVGGAVTYYARGAARGPYIGDITFVPKTSFKGDKATINFTGVADNGRTFKGKIIVTLTDTETELVITTRRETPVKLDSTIFSKVCQEQTGSQLDYVIFALPTAAQGVLYRDYKDEWNYASRVSATARYTKKDIDGITFVPADGFVGEVKIGYAGYNVSGKRYNGELVIQVQQGLDDAISYNDNGGGAVRFRRADFDAFCKNATGWTILKISFTPPLASQGRLYLSGSAGAEVEDGVEYAPAQIDLMTFVAATGFEGVVRIPFSGTGRNNEEFKGTAELYIQSSGKGNGDINYTCVPEQSVKLELSDFNSLCQSLTGERLHYITFQRLPERTQGSLYHNRTSAGGMGTRVAKATKYYYSATPYIRNLSFWAAEDFTYTEIPFTGASVSGKTFTAILAISNGSGAGGGSAGTVTYSCIGQNPVTFSGKDFDSACRQATNNPLAYVRLDLPGSEQGILYYDYRAEDPDPMALESDAMLFLTGEVSIDKVSFIAAKGYSGTVSIRYTGWDIDGRDFQGTVQISAESANAMGGLVRYETQGEPVHFRAGDIQMASGSSPASLRLTKLPHDSQGRIYYQYSGPAQYSWEGNTSTTYTLSGDPSISNLTFVPKAGYYGVVEITYSAANANGTETAGSIQVTVAEPYGEASFTDLEGCSLRTRSAVEYLTAMGVVIGVGDGKYDPGASIRRRDFCVMLTRAFQFTVGSTAKGFKDVPDDSYYAEAVNQMYALGVVNGVGGGKFDPNSPVTRQDAALMVQRALHLAGISAPDSSGALEDYSDSAQVKAYAQGAVGGMVQMGIFPVSSGGKLAPRERLTRADMALLLHGAMTQ